MPAISPIEVEGFREAEFKQELIDVVNSMLRATPCGQTVEISESRLIEILGGTVEAIRRDMERALELYRAVGWRAIYRLNGAGGDGRCWQFNGRCF